MRAWLFAALLALPLQDPREAQRILRHSPLEGPPADPTNAWADDPGAAHLGQWLFFDKRLSGNGAIACATCHDPARAFADGRPLPQGAGTGARHAPSLWNVAWQRWLFWDGRADSLWSQALHPIEDPVEMGGSRESLARLLADDRELGRAFEDVFGPLPDLASKAGIDRAFANAGKALAAHERRFSSRSSAFDAYAAALRSGDLAAQRAYPEPARRGLSLFVGKAGCRQCHAGPLFSDGEFHNIGVPTPDRSPPTDAGRLKGVELLRQSRFNAAGAFSDDPRGARAAEIDRLAVSSELWGQFRTPSLRNAARTAPYMHLGQIATLRDVLRYYSTLEGSVPAGHHGEQVLKPLHLSEAEIDELIAFLETLTDDDPRPELLAPPTSPRPAAPPAAPRAPTR